MQREPQANKETSAEQKLPTHSSELYALKFLV